jgi:hypothetical protein
VTEDEGDIKITYFILYLLPHKQKHNNGDISSIPKLMTEYQVWVLSGMQVK